MEGKIAAARYDLAALPQHQLFLGNGICGAFEHCAGVAQEVEAGAKAKRALGE